ncbi:MAG: B12-binding domain-containing radical SAM protein [Lachnospiraceae bacterium]|nr:B12-binding domain-containing radical SAM protein [Lachnospiraceae bacterium]
MRFLLVAINAKYIHSNLAVYSLKEYAAEYATEFIKRKNEIEIAEYTINQYTDKILQDIYTKKPDYIGFSCYIWNVDYVLTIVENIKKILPNVEIWLGGPEVSYNAVQVLEQNSAVTGVLRGEGEVIFKNLLNAIACDTEYNTVRGLTYRKNAGIIVENEDEQVTDLSTIPFVYRNLKEFENRIIYYESSRGCPFSCSYCLSSIDKHLRFRDLETVKKELKFFIDNKVAQVKFVDRTFNCKKDHSIAIWKYIKEHDNGITNFHFEIAADILNEEELEVIRQMRPGLIQLEVGVQSTNEDTITLINRKMDFSKVAAVVEKIKSFENTHLHLDLIAGLPKENIDSFANSFNMVYSVKPHQLQLGFLKVLHGSNMELQIEENGLVYNSKAPYEVLSTKWISFGDVLRLKKVEEVLEIYYNSGQFGCSILELEKYFDTPFGMYDSLGQYYSEHAPNGEKHSRVQRYELLLDFVSDLNLSDDEKNIFVQLLTYDFYLRDNVKNRPSFAKSLDGYKKTIVHMYVEEEQKREILPDYEGFNSKQLAKMTHIEVFDFDVTSYTKKGELIKGTYFMVFDYKNRNPLDSGARTITTR